jgi:hypothetical protein
MQIPKMSVRLTRPIGSNGPFEHRPQRSIVAVGRPVFIGNHNPGDHYAPVARVWIVKNDLYDNARPRRSR